MTTKQVQAIINMTNYIDKGKNKISMNPISWDMPSVVAVDYKHIKQLLKSGKIKKLGVKSYQTERIFAFLSDYINKVEDSLQNDAFDEMP